MIFFTVFTFLLGLSSVSSTTKSEFVVEVVVLAFFGFCLNLRLVTGYSPDLNLSCMLLLWASNLSRVKNFLFSKRSKKKLCQHADNFFSFPSHQMEGLLFRSGNRHIPSKNCCKEELW